MFVEFPVTKLLVELEEDNLLPAILFRTSRRQCDQDIDNLATTQVGLINEREQTVLAHEINAFIDKYRVDPLVILGHAHYQALILTGSGAHHAGQLLLWRLLLEELMSKGLLRLLIATGTVAAGVDFPARSVVITAHSKRGAEGFNVLSSSEFQQMSGRAGRRGKDAVGLCIIAPGVYSDARLLYQVIQRPPEPLKSAYFAAPATVLNLLKYRNVDDLRFTVERSLAAFLDRRSAAELRIQAETIEHGPGLQELPPDKRKREEKRARRLRTDADGVQNRQGEQLESTLKTLDSLGYLSGSGLSEKGGWAANLCTSLVLQLAEAIADGIFYELNSKQLVGAVAALAGDANRSYFRIRSNPVPRAVFTQLEKVVERVSKVYQNPVTAELKVLPDAATTAISWMEAKSWSEFSAFLRLSGVSEGDVSRLVTQTADHLQQLTRLHETHPELASVAAEGRKAILRPPFSETLEPTSLSN